MELIQLSETSAATHRTPGKFPEDYLLHSEHGGSLKTTTFETFIWKICQSTLTVSMTNKVVWQETSCINHNIKVFFYLTSLSMSAKIFTAFRQSVYLTFEAVVTNVGILSLNLIEFSFLNCQLISHNLQLTANSGQIHLFRAWNVMQLHMSALYTFRQRIWPCSSRLGSWDKAIGIVTSLWTGRSGVFCWPEEEMFCFSQCPNRLWCPYIFLSNAWRCYFLWVKPQDMKLTTGFQLEPALRMCGAIPQIPLYAFMT